MTHIDFNSWREELLFTGNIIQDDDESVSQLEKEKRFNRYIELVDSVTGTEGVEAFLALIESLRAKDDYGAYQGTYSALRRFPPVVVAKGLIAALPGLIHRQPEYAGDILSQVANSTSGEGLALLSAFRKEFAKAKTSTRKVIEDFVTQEENGGWLDGRRKGVIRPSST